MLMLCRYFGIMNELSSDEWRELKSRADQFSLQYDILGTLPLELVAHIAEHLEVVDIFRLRRAVALDLLFTRIQTDVCRSRDDGSRF